MRTKEHTPETKGQGAKKVYNLIIVDESGSMSIIHKEALAGINETITTCRQMQKLHPEMQQRVTLISFDSDHFKFHYDNTDAKDARKLTMRDYQPCGATPLYDAIGKGISKLNARPTLTTMSSSQSLPTVKRTALRNTTTGW